MHASSPLVQALRAQENHLSRPSKCELHSESRTACLSAQFIGKGSVKMTDESSVTFLQHCSTIASYVGSNLRCSRQLEEYS